MPTKEIFYSDTYKDEFYEYRHVILPLEQAQILPRTHLLTESEWRNLGLQMSAGWIHYMHHNPAFAFIGILIVLGLIGRCLASQQSTNRSAQSLDLMIYRAAPKTNQPPQKCRILNESPNDSIDQPVQRGPKNL